MQLVADAGTTAGRASTDSSCWSAIGPSSAAASISTSARSVGRWGWVAPRVGAGQEQQVAHQPAHPPGRAQRGLGRLGLLAVELLGQQLEVGQHAGQRRAQLVRGVGDELALAVEHRQGVAARGVERREHSLQRPGQLGDLVLGLGMGDAAARVPGALDLPGGVGQLDDRAHRPRAVQPGQQRENRAAEHPEQQEDLDSARVWSTSDSGRA